jgi:hypothetical protein
MKNTRSPRGTQGDDEKMNRKATRTLLRGILAALMLSAVFASSAGAAPAWKFEGKALEGKETVVGAAFDSSMTIPGLTTKCENFLYKLTVENVAGTGKGSVTELPLYNCTTNSKWCAVETIGAESLPWAAQTKAVSTTNYIVIEGVKVAILYAGELCALDETWATVTGTAGGRIDNTAETATFDAASFSATGTALKALGSTIEWKGVFPTEAFQTHRLQPLTVS